MKWEDLAPNYFDIVVVVVLVIGLIRGRKRGIDGAARLLGHEDERAGSAEGL